MGMFKEEDYTFRDLKSTQPTFGYDTGNAFHTEFLDGIREWMREMSDLRYDVQIDGENRVRRDVYFVAWEQDGKSFRGTEYVVKTRVNGPGSKTIELDCRGAFYSQSEFENTWKKKEGTKALSQFG